MSYSNNSIQILQNQNVIEPILKLSSYSHLTCFDVFDIQNDIFEFRSQGSGEVSERFIITIFEILFNILRQQYL